MTMDQVDANQLLRGLSLNAILRCFSAGGVVVFDHQLRYLNMAELTLSETGPTGAAVEGRTIFEVFGPEVAAEIEPVYRSALAGHMTSLDLPYGGRIFQQRLAPLLDCEHRIVAGLGFTEDVTAVRLSEQAVRDSEKQFRSAFDHAPIGKALYSLDGRYLRVNRAMCEMTGYSDQQLRTMKVADITHPDDWAGDFAGGRQLYSGALSIYTAEKRYLTATGEVVWVAASVSLARNEDGSPLNFIAQLQDITERKGHERLLAEERRRLLAAQSIGHTGSWELDITTGVFSWSDTLCELYGLDPGAFGADYNETLRYIHPDDVDQLRTALAACATEGTPLWHRHRVHRVNDGELRWFDTRGARYQDGAQFRIAGAVVDVTEQVLGEARLEHAALHDALTGLPNRRLVADRLGRALDRSDRQGQVVVLFCDLDGFKRVNDVHGHHAGDAVLVETALRLAAATRTGDTVGRMGGDEFVVICGVSDHEDPLALAELVTERIEHAMAEPIKADGLEHRVTISIGVCLADQGDSADIVLRNADVAMYVAKAQGKNGHALFDATLRSDVLDRATIERQIRIALAEETLELYYQPIVEPGTGRVRSVEALLRIPDGAGWYLDTFEAVTVAEQTGVIAAVGDRVLQVACTQVAAWRQQPEHEGLRVSVNRSAAEISRPGLYNRISGTVAATGLDPCALTIEITETVLLDASPAAIDDLKRLRADGIGIAIDDFGTGYASLRYLATLPINCLKVDRSFTAGLPHDPTCITIVGATIGLATDLGMGCVVEGVETIEQLNALPHNPGLLVQGFLYAEPQPVKDGLPSYLHPKPANGPKP